MAYPPCAWKSIASRMAPPPGPAPPAWSAEIGDWVSFTPSAATASQPVPGGTAKSSRRRAGTVAGDGGAEGSSAPAILPRAASVPTPASAQAASRTAAAAIRRQATRPKQPKEEEGEAGNEDEAEEAEPRTSVKPRRRSQPAPVASRRG